MKNPFSLLGMVLILGASGPARAQDIVTPVAEPAEPTLADPALPPAALFDAAQLEQLVGSIALYPDALIALILPASTVPSDVVLAARYLRDGGDPGKLDEQAWDDSVRALARYPDVLKWMDENLAWTKQLGEAFIAQPADVMNAVQRLRLKARAVGSLTTTAQQQVVVEEDTIAILPTQPDVIYVPYYDPAVVYVSRPTYYTRPFFTFGPAYATGFWLSYNVDWHRHRVWCIDRPYRERHWREHRHHWHRPSHLGKRDFARHADYRPWTPPRHVSYHRSRSNHSLARQPADRRFGTGSYAPRNENNGRRPSRWDGNYARPRHATGERFPEPPPSGPQPSVTAPLPLADPLPHALPSPLPNLNPRPNQGSGSYSRRNFADRRDHGARGDRGDRADRGTRNDRGDRHDRRRFAGDHSRPTIGNSQPPATARPAPTFRTGTPTHSVTPSTPSFRNHPSPPPGFNRPTQTTVRHQPPAPTPRPSSPSYASGRSRHTDSVQPAATASATPRAAEARTEGRFHGVTHGRARAGQLER